MPSQAGAWDSDAVVAFALERVRFVWSSAACRATWCAAPPPRLADVVPLRARRVAEALQSLRASADFQALAVLFKRVKNIARELVRRRRAGPLGADRAGRAGAARRARHAAAARTGRGWPRAIIVRRFTEIAGLRPAVDRFFTDVFVMADDARLRTARLTLMASFAT